MSQKARFALYGTYAHEVAIEMRGFHWRNLFWEPLATVLPNIRCLALEMFCTPTAFQDYLKEVMSGFQHLQEITVRMKQTWVEDTEQEAARSILTQIVDSISIDAAPPR